MNPQPHPDTMAPAGPQNRQPRQPTQLAQPTQPASFDSTPHDALVALMEQVGQTMGYEVVFVEWVGTGRHRRLRIFIDHPEGVALNDCTRMSPILSNALDAAEQDPDQPILQKLLATPYVLEVSSPGLDRPLGKLEHFRRFMGSKVTVRTRTAVEVGSNQKTFHGTIESVADDAADGRGTITLRMNDSGALVRIDLGVIKRANLVYEA